jgi:predicted DNA-binding transcriptional regulator YafY
MDDLIKQAISQKRLIDFSYNNRRRIAEPHILGTLKGVTQVLTYQLAGESSSQLPDWRRINVDKILDLQIRDDTFPGQRPCLSGKHSSWDDVHLAVVD